jgi:hypothetical protein
VQKKLDYNEAPLSGTKLSPQQEEEEQEESSEKPLSLKFLNLLKNQIKLDKEVEIQKENLFSNTVFNTIDAFKLFDSENSGYITEDDFARVSDELGLGLPAMERVICKFDKDQDGKLNYLEFCKALTPKNIIYTMSQNARYNSYKRVEVTK